MGFFAALGRMLGGRSESADALERERQRERLLRAWDLYREPEPGSEFPTTIGPADSVQSTPAAPEGGTHAYDREQWERKVRTILDRLPDSEDQWDDLTADVGALGLDPSWVQDVYRREFTLLVRRAVADRQVTPAEQRKLDLARSLIGLTEEQAESILNEVIAEAEAIFGQAVEGDR